MDVVILCGGYGRRLAGLWDEPKCLVPLGNGEPVLIHLLRQLRGQCIPLGDIVLLTGYRGERVIEALRERSLLAPDLIVLCREPRGTATAIRDVALIVEAPVLVLNGDTLPLYDLGDLISAWNAAAPDVLTAWCRGLSAGATILEQGALTRLARSSESDFARWLEREHFGTELRLGVTGFLDVGTPEGFKRAKEHKS